MKAWKRNGTIFQNHLRRFHDLVLHLFYRFPGKTPKRTDRQPPVMISTIQPFWRYGNILIFQPFMIHNLFEFMNHFYPHIVLKNSS